MKKVLLVLFIIALISGCGTTSQDNKAVNNPSLKGNANNQGGEPVIPEPSEGDVNEPNSPADPAVTEPNDDAEQESQKIEKTYHMNNIYDIVPNEPEGNKKVVLLTFDDGPKEEEMVTEMLRILDKHQAKAIFFVNGYRVKNKPELLKQIHDSGQIIGNHSWDHINLKNEPNEKIDQQIEDVQNYVEELIGEKPQFFRAPHGASNDYVREKAKQEGMLYMTWSAAAEEWVPKYQTPDAVVEHVMEQLRPGSNILMHELSFTVEALDTLLTRISEEGYSFVDPRTIELGIEDPTESSQQ